MKLHKKVHHHLKKHHKKYLAGASLGGIGLLAVKVFVLGTGIFGLFTHQSGVFAASYCSDYIDDLSCSDNMDGVIDGPCTYNWDTFVCESSAGGGYCATQYPESYMDIDCDMDPLCQWNGSVCEDVGGGGGSTANSCHDYSNENDCNIDIDGVIDSPCLWDGNSCISDSEATCSLWDEYTCDTASATDGPCFWDGNNCSSQGNIYQCSDYGSNESACTDNSANLGDICVFDNNYYSCISVISCNDYTDENMCLSDLGGFGGCFWDGTSSCLSENNINTCDEYGQNDQMCNNDGAGLGCFWDGNNCVEAPQACPDYFNENSCNLDAPFNCVWYQESCNSESNVAFCVEYGSNQTACENDSHTLGCFWDDTNTACKTNIVTLPNSTNTSEISSAFYDAGYIDNAGEFEGDKPISLSNTNGLIPTTISLTNNNLKLYLPANLHLKENDTITDYISTITPPTSYAVATVDSKPVISAISVGNTSQSIKITNGDAKLSIPAPGKSIGDPVTIYSSQNGTTWSWEKGGIVQNIGGQPYAVFNINHFTYFAIASTTGSFVINNDDSVTTGETVVLTISAPTAQNMRFSNDNTTRSDWESYVTSKSWDLASGNGTRIVYAEFDTDGNTGTIEASTSDSILFSNPWAKEGQLSLEISGATSECMYGTSLYLGAQDVKLDQAYTFTGSFSGQWYCVDYIGISSGWSLTIQVSNLTSAGGNVISGSNLLVSHGGATTQGDSACTGYDGAASAFYGSPYVLIEKASGSDKICKTTLNNVDIEVNVPAFQAPGDYVGTLTLTVPNF